MKIDVIKKPGDKRAPDIIDELCTTDAVGLQRARNFLTEQGTNKKIFTLDLFSNENSIETGQTITILDESIGVPVSGKCTSWSISVSGITGGAPASMTITTTVEQSL